MKLKHFFAILICIALLLCTACGGKTRQQETDTSEPEQQTANWSDLGFLNAYEQTVYGQYLSDIFSGYVKLDYQIFIQHPPYPPQIQTAQKYFAFYDLDGDDQRELLWVEDISYNDFKNRISNIMTIVSDKVTEIPINMYYSPDLGYQQPELLDNGVLRAEIGPGHVPGYAYLQRVGDAFVPVDMLTPPYHFEMGDKDTYNYSHYDTSYAPDYFAEGASAYETITEDEFYRLIKKLNGDAKPVELEPVSLLKFAQDNGLSTAWLGEPTDEAVPVAAPKNVSLPQYEGSRAAFESLLESRKNVYQSRIKAYYDDPDTVYHYKQPEKEYYAFYDLDGNGDNELFFGQENGDGRIIITEMWFFPGKEIQKNYMNVGMNVGRNDSTDTRVLSNGWIVVESGISEGNVQNCFLKYLCISPEPVNEVDYYKQYALWLYGREAAFYDYSLSQDLPTALTPEAYAEQRAEFERDAQVVELDWKVIG